MLRISLFIISLTFQTSVFSAEDNDPRYDYKLVAEKIAEDTYVFVGKKEDFSRSNGGNIVNTGFIVTNEGIIVIDNGPSLRYGRQMLAAIRKISQQPVIRVLITHQHPDHVFGTQAFTDVPVMALPETVDSIQTDAPAYADNMYRLVGEWMRGTESSAVSVLDLEGENIGGHQLEYLRFSGHTEADLVIFDKSTGVLFCGDLVFNGRTLTTPNANISAWLDSLDRLDMLPFNVLVPGHGDITLDNSAIKQTRDYLHWLSATLQASAENGLDMAELMQLPAPERFARLALFRHEYTRSITHLFPEMEDEILQESTQK